MSSPDAQNPLLGPMRDTFIAKRNKNTGLVPSNWLLVLLCILDSLRERTHPLEEDDIYTYDYTLKQSRQDAITRLLNRYALPPLPISKEGITVRGAPGLRFFRAIEGGRVVTEKSEMERDALLDEAVEVLREEISKVVGQKPVTLPLSVFEHAGRFVPALLESTANRSQGRVEQAIVGAKLQIRHPSHEIPLNAGFAGDRQTGREADYEIDLTRVIVTVTPKDNHFQSAKRLATEGRQVFLVVSDKAVASAKSRVKRDGCPPELVRVKSVEEYVTDNMAEVATDSRISAREMCMKLVAEYNRRIVTDNDLSLQVVLPANPE